MNRAFDPSPSVRPSILRLALTCMISLALIMLVFAWLGRSQPAAALPQPSTQAGTGLLIDALGPDSALAGTTITYTLLVTNATAQAAQNVVITNVWTRQTYNGNFTATGDLKVITYTFAPTAAQSYIRWSLGSLGPAAVGSLVLTMSITPTLQPSTTKSTVGSPTLLADVAVISSTTSGASGSNDSVNTLVVGPVMYLEKSFAPAAIRPGRLVTFTFKLTNRPQSQRADSIAATGVVITERLPAKTIFWSASGPASIAYSPTYTMTPNGLVMWALSNTLPPSQSVMVTLTLRVSPTLRNKGDVNSIVNAVSAFGFRSNEVTIARPGDAQVNLVGEDVLEKSVQVGPPPPPPPPPGNPPRTFPNRVITYTIAVYNPLTATLVGFRVTDTLPIYPVPAGQYFSYSGTLPVAPYSAPTLASVAGRTVAWDIPPIEAWGVYSFALRVLVPAQFDTNGLAGRIADDSVFGSLLVSNTVIYDNISPPEARVMVVPQITPYKVVNPRAVFSGYPVTYTLWITNVGDTVIHNIVLTDILPSGFVYNSMVSGPQPVITTPNVMWGPVTLQPYTDYSIQFKAMAYGLPSNGYDYCNKIAGYSPDTFIPTYDGCSGARPGGVMILNPFTLNKTATPNAIILGDSLQYKITVGNVSNEDYQISQIRDYLPSYFEYNGGVVWATSYPGPVDLPAHGTRDETFTVLARAVPRNVCNQLPANIAQQRGSVEFDIVNGGTWFNPGAIGAVMVNPQILLQKTVAVPAVAPADPVTYTVKLLNYTSNTYSDLLVTDTLPAGFAYARMLPGSPQPYMVTPGLNPVIVWNNLALPPNGTLSFTFVATASLSAGTGKENQVAAISAGQPDVCIPWLGSSYPNAKAGPKVDVKTKTVTYSKSVSPASVGPLGIVQYNVTVYNRGPYTRSNVIITDILPSSVAGPPPFRFYSNVTLPAGVTYLNTDPPSWRIDSLGYNKSVAFSFKARSTIYPGSGYKNYANSVVESGWIFTPESSYNGAPVTIIPGVGLDKVVSPTQAVTGSLVVYTITVYNQSGASLSGLRITDTLPRGFSYDRMVTTQYLPDSLSPLVWSTQLPVVNNGAQLILAFQARISNTLQSGKYYNRVVATAPNVSIPPTDDTAPVQVFGAPNVAATKVAGQPVVFHGDTLIYTITLVNESLQTVNARVTDTLPTGFSFQAPLGSTPGPDLTQPLVWYNIPLAPAETRDLGFVVSIASNAPTGTVYNQVNLSGAGYVFQGTGPTAPVLVKAQPTYDLQVSKDGMPKFVQAGDTITYTIVYTNDTDDGVTVSNAVLTDTLPSADVSVIGAGSPCWAESAPGVWLCNVGDLAPNQTGIATLVLQLNTAPPENYVLNRVAIGGTAPANAAEAILANNTASALTYAGVFPDVAIDKVVTPTLALTGDSITYTMALTNNSSVTLTLRVTDTMPTGFVFGNAIGATPAPVSTAPLVWSGLVLPPGQSIALTWRAVVGASTPPGFYYNAVDLDTDGLPLPGRTGLAQIETDLRRYYAVQISKSDGQNTAAGGQTLNYTIRYTNTSTNVPLTQILLTDMFSPTGVLTFLSGGWTQSATGVYTRSLPDLPPGGSNAVIVQLQLAPSLPPALLTISNTVRLDVVPTVRATELITSNHTSTDIDIVGGADIAVTGLTVTPARVRNGGTVTVVVQMINQGVISTTGPSNSGGWFGVDVYVKPGGAAAPAGPADRYYGFCATPVNPCDNAAQRWSLYKFVQGYGGPGLNPGQTWVLTYTYVVPDSILPTSGPLWVYAQADPFWGQNGDPDPTLFGSSAHGRIVEGNELNNISGPVAVYLNPNVYLPLIRK